MKDKLGICQWFHYEDHDAVLDAAEWLSELGIRHLRTGISWADFHRPSGPEWFQWMLEQLSDFRILLSVWHTPPSIAEGGVCNGPPLRLQDYADFIGQVEHEYGHLFESLELWNEPNNRYKWDFQRFDPQWRKFGRMIAAAASVARASGRTTVLGGMIPVDQTWLQLMRSYGAIDDIDVVAIHAFPEMWWPDRPCWDRKSHWHGWSEKVQYISRYAQGRSIWITETGLATWDMDTQQAGREELQQRMLMQAAAAPVDRLYWYSLMDLHPDRDAIEGFHVDENEYHLGLITWDGRRKPAFDTFHRLLYDAIPQQRTSMGRQ